MKVFVLALVVLVVAPLAHAAYVNETIPHVQSAFYTSTQDHGWVYTFNTSVRIDAMTKVSSSDVSACEVRDLATCAVLASGSFSGDSCVLNNTVEPGIGQSLVFKKAGAGNEDQYYKGSITFPFGGTVGSWTAAELEPDCGNVTAGTAYRTIETFSYELLGGGGGPTLAGLNRESIVKDSVSTNTTINTPVYTEILLGDFEILTTYNASASAVINLYSPTYDSESTCRALINGVDYDSETTRSNTANQYGVMNVQTTNTTLAAGNHTISVECKRDTARAYVITSSNVAVFLNNLSMESHKNASLASSGGYSMIDQGTFTTDAQENNATIPMIVVADYSAEYDYASTGYMSTILEFDGTNCTGLPRYGTSGSSGNVGGACAFLAENETTYTHRTYASGEGNVTYTLNIKEMVVGENEYNTTSLAGLTTTTGAYENIANVTITPSTASQYIYVKAGVPVNGTATARMYLSAVGATTENGSVYARTVSGNTGVVIMSQVFGPGVVTVTPITIQLWAYCAGGNCTVDGGDLTAYVADLVASEEDGFTVTANHIYNLSSLDGFWVAYNGVNVSTGTSSVKVVTTDELINITVGKEGFFPTTITNWNTSFNITVNLSQGYLANYSLFDLANNTVSAYYNITVDGVRSYENATPTTPIYLRVGENTLLVSAEGYYPVNNTVTHTLVVEQQQNMTGLYDAKYQFLAQYGGSPVTNFSVKGVNATYYEQTQSTTNGSLSFNLLQGYDYYFNFSSETYANENVTLPVNASSHQYTFNVLLTNTFNLTFIDELTEGYVNESVTLELISDVFSQNYTITATNGTNISLLTPSEYTLRYRSTSYTERDYIVTLTSGSFNNIDLYMINLTVSSQLSVIVEDTGGNRVENATVKLLRYYVSCNCYEIVEMSKTSANGDAVFWVQAIEGFYKWAVEYEGETKFLSSSPENIVTDTRVFTINLGDNYYDSFENLLGLASLIQYNRTTGALTFTWNDPNGLITEGCLEAEYVSGTNWLTLGPSCESGSAGSIILILDNETRYKYEAYVETASDYSDHVLHSGWIENLMVAYAFGSLGVFLGVTAVTGLALLFSFSAIAVLVVTVIGVLFMSILGLMPFTMSFIMGLVAMTLGFSLYLMRR